MGKPKRNHYKGNKPRSADQSTSTSQTNQMGNGKSKQKVRTANAVTSEGQKRGPDAKTPSAPSGVAGDQGQRIPMEGDSPPAVKSLGTEPETRPEDREVSQGVTSLDSGGTESSATSGTKERPVPAAGQKQPQVEKETEGVAEKPSKASGKDEAKNREKKANKNATSGAKEHPVPSAGQKQSQVEKDTKKVAEKLSKTSVQDEAKNRDKKAGKNSGSSEDQLSKNKAQKDSGNAEKVKHDKEKFLSMTLEEKRKFYHCKEDYRRVEDIEKWPEYFENNKDKLLKLMPPKTSKAAVVPNYDIDDELNSRVCLWRGDIARLEIDCIVNAANNSLLGGGGVDGAIHSAAGRFLYDECKTLCGCETGDAKATAGYLLPAKYVIHTVGPVGVKPDLLESCYTRCLDTMILLEQKTIAFPCISTGIYGYPNDEAVHVVLRTVRQRLEKLKHRQLLDKVGRIVFCLFLENDVDTYGYYMQRYFPVSLSPPETTADEKKGSSGVENMIQSDSAKEATTYEKTCPSDVENVTQGDSAKEATTDQKKGPSGDENVTQGDSAKEATTDQKKGPSGDENVTQGDSAKEATTDQKKGPPGDENVTQGDSAKEATTDQKKGPPGDENVTQGDSAKEATTDQKKGPSGDENVTQGDSAKEATTDQKKGPSGDENVTEGDSAKEATTDVKKCPSDIENATQGDSATKVSQPVHKNADDQELPGDAGDKGGEPVTVNSHL